MRALALGLVLDPNEAEDVAQDAALALLLNPPPEGVAARPWIATVVRRLAWRRRRAALRRADHEADAQPGSDGGGDALERIDTQRRLLEAVRALEEPLRTTVVRRYFEGKSSVEIARLSGVPAATVRARLKRARERLRTRLDRDMGSRAAWMSVLLPLVPREFAPVAAGAGVVTASLVTEGVLTMTATKIALAMTCSVILGLGIWKPWSTEAPLESPERPVPAQLLGPLDDVVVSSAQEPRSSARVEPTLRLEEPQKVAQPVEPWKPSAEPSPGTLRARFVNEQGEPWGDIEVLAYLGNGRSGMEVARGRSDGSGRLDMQIGLKQFARFSPDQPAASEHQLVVRGRACVARCMDTLIRENQVTDLGDVVLGAGSSVRGQVVDQSGVAIEGARVGAVAAERIEVLTPRELDRFARLGDEELDELLTVSSLVDGRFDLIGLEPGRQYVWAWKEGHRYCMSEVLELTVGESPEEARIVLSELLPEDRISGRVVGPDGAGIPAWIARTTRATDVSRLDSLSCDPDGRFEFVVHSSDALYDLDARDPRGQFTRVQLKGIRPGDLDVVIRLQTPEPLQVRVVDQNGAPIQGAEFMYGIAGMYGSVEAKAGAAGEYTLPKPIGEFRLEVDAPGFRELTRGPFEASNLPDRIDMVLVRALALRGRVSAQGAPVPNALVEVFEYDADGSMTFDDLRCPISCFAGGQARTDAEGLFELYADVEGPFVIRASHSDWVDCELGPMHSATDDLELELSRGGTIEGILHLPGDEPTLNRIVAVHRGDGRPRCARAAADGSFRFEGLMPGDWRVFGVEQEFSPHGGSYSSYSGSDPIEWDCRVELGGVTRFELTLDER